MHVTGCCLFIGTAEEIVVRRDTEAAISISHGETGTALVTIFATKEQLRDLAAKIAAAVPEPDLFTEVEYGSVHAEALLASTTSTLRRRLEDHPAIQAALLRMRTDDEFGASVAGRVREILDAPFDKRFHHPKDLALAAYVFLLGARGDRYVCLIERIAAQPEGYFGACSRLAKDLNRDAQGALQREGRPVVGE